MPSSRSPLPAAAVAAALAALAAACGGPDEFVPDRPDAGGEPDGPPGPTPDRAVFVAGDFQATGIVSRVEAPSLRVDQAAVAGIAGADPAIRRFGDELFVINRFGTGGDNVTVIDARTLQLVAQHGTGPGSNPQDVALVGNKLYVAALGEPDVLVIDRSAPGAIGRISLASLDPDGLPDCVSVAAVGPRVFVACGLLDGFAPVRAGRVAVIDASTDTVVTSFDLPAQNPVGWFERTPEGSAFGGDLVISTVPDFADYGTGCLARVSTGPTPAATCGPTNQALGGYVNRAVAARGGLWIVVSAFTPTFESSGALHRIDLANAAVGPALTPDTIVAQDLAICGDHLFLADSTFGASGVRVHAIDGATVDELTAAPLDLGLPPGFGNAIACGL